MRIAYVAREMIGNWTLMTVVFFATLPWTGPAVLWTLRTVFGALNSFGAGR